MRGAASAVLASQVYSSAAGRGALASAVEAPPPGLGEILGKAGKRALGGGAAQALLLLHKECIAL
jgi:hypothetical protein